MPAKIGRPVGSRNAGERTRMISLRLPPEVLTRSDVVRGKLGLTQAELFALGVRAAEERLAARGQ